MKTLKENIPIEQKKKMNLYILNLSSTKGVFTGAVSIVTPLSALSDSLVRINQIVWMCSYGYNFFWISNIFYFKKIIIKPLKVINNAAKKIANGEIGNRVNVSLYDEVGGRNHLI
ncbi:MAG: hypothetical protein ACLTGX_04300 [Clostridium sp.]